MSKQEETQFRRVMAALKDDVREPEEALPHPSRAFRAPIPPHVYIAEALEMLHDSVESLRAEVRSALGHGQSQE